MRYVTFSLSADPTPRLGALRGNHVLDLSVNGGPPSLLALIQAGPAQWQRAAAVAEAMGDAGHLLDAVRLHAPIPRPLKNVFCLGLNYVAHAKESAARATRRRRFPRSPSSSRRRRPP
jgi:2-keto-4-pentenoate hydratase/2-oxohepta-3-ene-1,7-dioic acid hydratase in catechol pathway